MELIYEFDDLVRKRMLATLTDHIAGDVNVFFFSLCNDLVKTYGCLKRPAYEAVRSSLVTNNTHGE